MLKKGKDFLENMLKARSKIATLGANNIDDGFVSFLSLSFDPPPPQKKTI